MAFFEHIASNANNTLNSESAMLTKKKLIKRGTIGALVCLLLAVALIVTGVLLLVFDLSIVAGVLCLVVAGISFFVLIIFLIMLIVGIGMAAGGAGAKILDTTSVCPYCQTILSAKEKQCPSCGRAKSGK